MVVSILQYIIQAEILYINQKLSFYIIIHFFLLHWFCNTPGQRKANRVNCLQQYYPTMTWSCNIYKNK